MARSWMIYIDLWWFPFIKNCDFPVRYVKIYMRVMKMSIAKHLEGKAKWLIDTPVDP